MTKVGYKHTEETKQKIKKNHAKYWAGKKRPDMSKFISEREFVWGDRISKALKGKTSNMKGKKMTEESKKKMSTSAIKRIIKRGKPTSIEIKLYDELKRRKIKFEKQYVVNNKFIVDAYIEDLNLIIEADGDYWHTLKRVIIKDKAEKAYLTKCGYRLLRIWETDFNNGEYINTLNKELIC